MEILLVDLGREVRLNPPDSVLRHLGRQFQPLRDAELGVQEARRQLEEARAQRVASEARVKELERLIKF